MSLLQRFIFFISTLIVLSACSKIPVDFIVHHGNVYTVNAAFSKVEAIAVTDGRIVDCGTSKKILRKYRAKEMMDAQNSFVYPGFHDAHAHFLGLGLSKYEVPLYGLSSIESIQKTCIAFYQKHPYGFLYGRGWDQQLLPGKQFPSRACIDSLFPEIPVMLIRIDGHAALLNTKALELTQLMHAASPAGGVIEEINGIRTGIVIDKAYEQARMRFPAFPIEKQIDALHEAEKICFDLGITCVTDAGESIETIHLLDSLYQNKQLQIRLNTMIDWNLDTLPNLDTWPFLETDPLYVRSVKVYADGALGSRGALLHKPYQDRPNYYGLSLHANDYLYQLYQALHHSPYQVCTHAIGDSAVSWVAHLYASVLQPGNDRRWRIEHMQVFDPTILPVCQNFGIIPSVQPTHATSDAAWAQIRIGDRIRYAYAYRDLLKIHQWLPLGTDFPVEYPNPLFTFCSAVYRTNTNSIHEAAFYPEQAIGKEDALRGMTIWAAKAAFLESITGSLEPGKSADFQIYPIDLLQAAPESLFSLKPSHVFMRGKQVK